MRRVLSQTSPQRSSSRLVIVCVVVIAIGLTVFLSTFFADEYGSNPRTGRRGKSRVLIAGDLVPAGRPAPAHDPPFKSTWPPPPHPADPDPDLDSETDRESAFCTMKVTPHNGYTPDEAYASRGSGNETYKSCPVSHTIKCAKKPAGRRRDGGRGGKALVLYMFSIQAKRADQELEDGNFDFFVKHGLIGDGVPTQLFTGVDFVIYRHAPRENNQTNNITEVARDGNIRLLHIPQGPCDLCAHSRVLEFLQPERVQREYRRVFFLNSGVRGPFVSPDSASWVDVVAMAGRAKASNQADVADPPPLVAAATAISFEVSPHPQSYFLSMPMPLLRVVYPIFARTCFSTNIYHHCAIGGEVLVGPKLREAGYSVYSLARRYEYRASEKNFAAMRHRFGYNVHGRTNPCCNWIPPCDAIFLKHGGSAWRIGCIPQTLLRVVRKLSTPTDADGGNDDGEHRFAKLRREARIFFL